MCHFWNQAWNWAKSNIWHNSSCFYGGQYGTLKKNGGGPFYPQIPLKCLLFLAKLDIFIIWNSKKSTRNGGNSGSKKMARWWRFSQFHIVLEKTYFQCSNSYFGRVPSLVPKSDKSTPPPFWKGDICSINEKRFNIIFVKI